MLDMRKYLTSWLRNNPGLIALLLVSFFIYAPSLSGDFVIDDVPFVRDNPYIRDVSHIPRFFTRGLWENSALEINTESQYRPMNLVPMLLNHALWGSNPAGYHVFLLLLHLANTCLVYVLIRELATGSAMAAVIGSAMFALHPARVESVAWISGGIDPLVTFFLLGALLAHRSFVASPDDIKEWRYLALSLLCFQLALWSKEVAIVFPLIVVVHDLIYRRKIDWSAAFLHTMVVAGYLIARSLVLGATGKWSAIDLSQFSRALDFALGYSEMLMFPIQVPFYIQPPEHAVSSVMGIVGAIVIVMLAGFCWRYFDMGRKKALAFSFIWMVVFFWPAVLMAFYTGGYYAGRFLYVPAVGVAILAANFYDYLIANYQRLKIPVMTSCVLIIASYGFITWKEIPAWHDDGTAYAKIAAAAPENAVGFIGLGKFQFNRGDYVAAERNFLIALQKAKTTELRVESLVALGTIYGMTNDLARSESYLKEAVKIDQKNSEAWTGLGNLAQIQGHPYEAISSYEKAISIRPGNYEAAMNLAMAYDKTGQFQRGDLIRQQASAIRH